MAKKKKARAKETTPGVFRSMLRSGWLKSPERAEALKRTGYCCEMCGVKQSKAKGKEQKVVVHHNYGVDLTACYREAKGSMFVPSEDLTPLCPDCHHKIHHPPKEESDE